MAFYILPAIVASGFDGSLTLEYLPAFHHNLIANALWAKSIITTADS